MKLYVIPVEKACDGKCPPCITKFKGNTKKFGHFLNPSHLVRIEDLNIDKIEITGGGEPFWHPMIDDIIAKCVLKAPTQVYTHGGLLSFADPGVLKKLSCLCISRLHHDPDKNLSLMGIRQEIELAMTLGIPIKLSLVLFNSGIGTIDDVRRYLDWAAGLGVSKVVIRQLFEFAPSETSCEYREFTIAEYVTTAYLPKRLGVKRYSYDGQGNPIFMWENMEVEAEQRTCACEANYPLLRSNGRLYLGWSDKLWAVDENA